MLGEQLAIEVEAVGKKRWQEGAVVVDLQVL